MPQGLTAGFETRGSCEPIHDQPGELLRFGFSDEQFQDGLQCLTTLSAGVEMLAQAHDNHMSSQFGIGSLAVLLCCRVGLF